MRTREIILPKLHIEQDKIKAGLTRFSVLDCGRRFGKDILLQNWLAEGMLAGYPCALYSPIYKDTLENWTWFCDVFNPIIKKRNAQNMRLEILTGGFIDLWSLQGAGSKDASRGRHYKRIVVNEAAKIETLEYSWNAVIRATLADLKGEAIIASTPKGLNFFHNLYMLGLSGDGGWSAHKRTSYDNPYIDPAEIDAIKAAIPEIYFNQEYMAEFVSLEGAVFRRVQEAMRSYAIDAPESGHTYGMAVDPAASVDYTAISVFDLAEKREVYIDRFNRVDYPVLVDRIAAVYERFACQFCRVETNGIGQPVIDMLYNRGVGIDPFTTTNASKGGIIQGLQSGLEHGEVALIDDPIWTGELLSFESKRTASGNFTYAAPDGQHDDTVMARAMCWDAISDNAPVMAFA